MERVPLRKLALLILAATGVLTGCSQSAETSVSADEEKMFKNPGPIDRSKIPADAHMPKGPAFVGEPTGATKPDGGTPPPPVANRR